MFDHTCRVITTVWQATGRVPYCGFPYFLERVALPVILACILPRRARPMVIGLWRIFQGTRP